MDIIHVRQDHQFDNSCAVYHLRNPTSASWRSLLPPLVENYGVSPVSLTAWIAKLEDIQTATSETIQEIPAVKLLGFFKELESSARADMPTIDVRKAMESSTTMRALEPISASLMYNWLKQWKY
jgi:hypothetical protein